MEWDVSWAPGVVQGCSLILGAEDPRPGLQRWTGVLRADKKAEIGQGFPGDGTSNGKKQVPLGWQDSQYQPAEAFR